MGHLDPDQVRKVVLARAEAVPGLDEPGPCIGQFHLGPQDIKPGHRARLKALPGVEQFAFEEHYSGLLNPDLLVSEQDGVVGQFHIQHRFGENRLMGERRPLPHQLCSPDTGEDPSPFINTLHHPHLRLPALIRSKGEPGDEYPGLVHRGGLLCGVIAGHLQLRPGNRPGLEHNTLCGLEILA